MNAYILQNTWLRSVFRPDDGGRLVSLMDQNGREYIWNNLRTQNLFRYYGANYDDMSAGGVEEAFPTGLQDVYKGDAVPFFGEIWAVAWQAEQWDDVIRMVCYSAIYPVRITKTYELTQNELRCTYLFENLGDEPVPFLFGVHPSLCVVKGDRIMLPSNRYRVGAAKNAGIRIGEEIDWPMAGDRDLARFFDDHRPSEYIEFRSDKMSEGYIALRTMDGRGLSITFDPAFFPALSIWLIGGGWRGHRCLMAEFFSGHPFILSEAVNQGTCPVLSAGENAATMVVYTIS